MTEFNKYTHVERMTSEEVEGILDGTVYVFPKLDGANCSMWWDSEEGRVRTGSRNRAIPDDDDNHGFRAWAEGDSPNAEACRAFVEKSGKILFGEWLVPHAFKGYVEYAWRDFYVFDVGVLLKNDDEDAPRKIFYTDYAMYANWLNAAGVNYIEPLTVLNNPTMELLEKYVKANKYMLPKGSELVGEGIVIKRYEFRNRWGNYKVGKIIAQDFAEAKVENRGTKFDKDSGEGELEVAMAVNMVSAALVDKTIAKIQTQNELERWDQKLNGQLIGMVYHDALTEELWDQLKKFKDPKVDFKRLRRECTSVLKTLRRDLF